MAGTQKTTFSDGKEHLLAVRVQGKSMRKLHTYCSRKSESEGRRVSYREVVENLIAKLK